MSDKYPPAYGAARHIEEREAREARLRREIEVLRFYGNKDCTTMADDALKAERDAAREAK